METTTGSCSCGEQGTLYAGSCYECCMDATGGNFAEQMQAEQEAITQAAIDSGRLMIGSVKF
jgi:hypothetical protein